MCYCTYAGIYQQPKSTKLRWSPDTVEQSNDTPPRPRKMIMKTPAFHIYGF